MKSGGIQRQIQAPGSALQKYRHVVLGDRGLCDFFAYEIVLTFIIPLPGKFGVRLRRLLMPRLFNFFGQKVYLGKNIIFRRPGQIHIGHHVTIDPGVTFDVKSGKGQIEIHDNVHIGGDTILSCPGGKMSIGSGSRIGSSCRLGSLQGLSLGKECVLGDNVCIIGAGHAYDRLDLPIINQPLTCKGKTIIGDQVKIGSNTTLLDGVLIGSNVTLASDSLINKNVETGCIMAGVPAICCK